MKRIVLTNNKKVQEKFNDKAEMRFMEDASCHDIYIEARKVVENGGKLLMDPTAGNIKSYYKSLVFIEDGSDSGVSNQRSLELIDKCLNKTSGDKKAKEPVLSGIMQKKEIDTLIRILA